MSDETPAVAELKPIDQSSSEQPELAPIEDRDFVLCILADFANRFGFQVGITLHTHGFLVSGVLISKTEFFEGVAAFVKAGIGPDAEEGLFDQLAANSRKGDELPNDDNKDYSAETRYLHLKNVQIMVPNQPAAPGNPTVWRMRIDEISGFTIGQFGTAPPA